jgi:hypothetical protein
MKRIGTALAALGAIFATSIARPVLANAPIGVGTPVEGPPSPTTGLEPGNRRTFWSNAPVGMFASSIVDAGYIYLRPQIAVGYGRPHWNFIQAETFATASAGGLGSYGGLRVALPHLEMRSGMRYQFPFGRSFYAQAERYDRFSLESREGPSSRYYAWDSEVLLSAPILHGAVFGLFGAYHLMGVPDGFDVYEELLRVVARPPWLFRARLGHAFLLGEKGSIRVGPVAEMVYNPARNTRVLRAGIVATVVLTHHLEVLATFVPTIASSDSIGLAGGDFGQLGVRFRWGTPHGEPTPPPESLAQPQQ